MYVCVSGFVYMCRRKGLSLGPFIFLSASFFQSYKVFFLRILCTNPSNPMPDKHLAGTLPLDATCPMRVTLDANWTQIGRRPSKRTAVPIQP